MGKRGPRPRSSAAQERLGVSRPDRRRTELKVQSQVPPCPSWVTGKARRCWHKIAPWLDEAGLLTRLDQVALALLVCPLSDYLMARDIVESEAKTSGVRFITTTDKGNTIQHPAVGVMNKAWERCVKMLKEFGMTPAARVGLAVAGYEQADPMADLLERIANRRSKN